jgi:hypothetical protein
MELEERLAGGRDGSKLEGSADRNLRGQSECRSLGYGEHNVSGAPFFVAAL